MKNYYLAVDIGASSGRHMISWMEKGILKLEEIYRFENRMENKDGTLCWDLDRLFKEIVYGLKACKAAGKVPKYMGIDTWAVDFVLLDKSNQVLGKTVGYRDKRTEGMDLLLGEQISFQDLYRRTGIQKQIFNTIYQLLAVKKHNPEYLEQAESLLMIPDYFNFLLTGVKKQEYTNATTTQMVNSVTKDWDYELIEKIGFPSKLFKHLTMPDSLVGKLSPKIIEKVGFSCSVLLPATHDTGSAVLAVPCSHSDVIYISSGTWSLMGTERMKADCSSESMKANFTNEGGYGYRFRHLKNIMGLWMIQSVKKELKDIYSFAALCEMASKVTIASILDCNHESFLAPESMIESIQEYCRNTNQQVPSTPEQIAAVIYQSLAKCYEETIREIEQLTGKKYKEIYIIGGGANADYLNQLTSEYTKRTVYTGPAEATAIGNIIAQMLRTKEFSSLSDARKCIYNSFEIKQYNPS